MRLFCTLAILIFSLLSGQEAFAQRLVSKLSQQEISINSTFTGGELTLFGNVEPAMGESGGVTGPFDVVVVIEGASNDFVVRQKSRQSGIWLNAQQVTFSGTPSYFHTLSSQTLENIVEAETWAKVGINFQSQIQKIDGESDNLISQFSSELVRLMEQAQFFGQSPNAISFHSNTFYSARLELPSNVPNGTYLATTFLFQNGQLVDRDAARFFVRTIGVEKFISNSARDFPALYGLACVMLALFVGWLGGVVFRR